jgi:hypothetical protein
MPATFFAACVFRPGFSQSFHKALRNLNSSVRKQHLARLPSGLFFVCHKTFSIKAVQPSPMVRLGLCVWTFSPLKHSISTLFDFPLFFEVLVMRLTLPALVLGLLVAQGAMAAGDGTAALGGGLGGALGNVVGQSMGGSTGAAIGAGVAGAAGSAVGARKGSRTKAAIGGGVGAAGGSIIGNSLGGKTGSTIGAGLGGALGGGVGSNLGKGHKGH